VYTPSELELPSLSPSEDLTSSDLGSADVQWVWTQASRVKTAYNTHHTKQIKWWNNRNKVIAYMMLWNIHVQESQKVLDTYCKVQTHLKKGVSHILYKAQLTQNSLSNQADFYWSVRWIQVTILKISEFFFFCMRS